jgi:hypothetical protein
VQNKPIDRSRLGSMRCVIAPEPRTNRDGVIRQDADGVTQYVVGVAVVQKERRGADVINVVVSGQPSGVDEGSLVEITGLTAVDWEVDGRHGTSWRAESIALVSAAAAGDSAVRAAGPGGPVAPARGKSAGGDA